MTAFTASLLDTFYPKNRRIVAGEESDLLHYGILALVLGHKEN